MELLADKTKEEIATIWTQHFASKDAVCAIIPYDTFKKMKELYDIHKTVSIVFTRVFDVLRFNSFFIFDSFCFHCPVKKDTNLWSFSSAETKRILPVWSTSKLTTKMLQNA